MHYPAYYTATSQNEKITSHVVSFYNLLRVSIRSVDQPKTLTSLSNRVGYTGVDELPDYLRSDTEDVKKSLSLTAANICLATVIIEK